MADETLSQRLVEETAAGTLNPTSGPTVPAIPSVSTVEPGAMRKALSAVKQILDIREGRSGSVMDMYLTLRDLVEAGVLNLNLGNGTVSGNLNGASVISGGANSGSGGSGGGGGGGGGYIDPRPILSVPPTPTDLTVFGAFRNVVLTWDIVDYQNKAFVEIWRADSNSLGLAVKVGTSTANIYDDASGVVGATYWYWIRAVNQQAVIGAYNAVGGTSGGLLQIGNTDLGPLVVEAANIAANTITNSEIAAGTVTATELATGAVTATKLAANSIAVGNLAVENGAIVNAMIANAAIDTAKVSSLSAAVITFGTMSGDRIAVNTLNATAILANSITAAQMAANSITTASLAAGSVIASTISVSTLSAITANMGTITAGTLTAGTVFAGALSAATGTFSGSLSAATGTFSGTLTAAAVNAVNTINIANNALTVPISGVATGIARSGSVPGSNSRTTALTIRSITTSPNGQGNVLLQMVPASLSDNDAWKIYTYALAELSIAANGDFVTLTFQVVRTIGATRTIVAAQQTGGTPNPGDTVTAFFSRNIIQDSPGANVTATYSLECISTNSGTFGNTTHASQIMDIAFVLTEFKK